ncbi:autotransporter-associated beta strand repeat-containing protein [Luteolibacter ambystomatis]|uniref:Autotransporter-associated beta strand repeat-containing protein n=1 Tax=Luteolibacter ambystomatis TaxID=2824561 RepID=A0A975J0V9_9BACT|nr:autotransporter-associated beta strand repeat-containing protein [Luteolibacter ambystomatis]QUE51973.1 autotransporter-associated beta strand repeat-containing protein [Luteolibacter ambystomatis]
MKPFSLFTSLILLSLSAHADVWIGGTASWNTDANWQDGTKPTSGDGVIFNSSSTANLSTTLDAAFSITGLTLASPTGAVTIANGTSGSLTIGSGGIDMSAATQNLTFSFTANSLVALGANQTWNVASGRSLTFVSSNTTIRNFDLGSRTITKSGTGNLVLGQGVNLTNGVFDLQAGNTTVQAGSSTNTTSAASVSYKVGSSATLTLTNNTGTLTFASPIEINGGNVAISGGASHSFSGAASGTGGTITASLSSTGTVLKTFSGSFTGSGTYNLRNEMTSSTTHAIVLSGNNSGFTGTFNINGTTGSRIVRLTAANSGSAGAAWSVSANNSLQINGVAVNLGSLSGAGGVTSSSGTSSITVGALNASTTYSGIISGATNVTKTGSGTWTVSGVNSYTGTTTISGGKMEVTGSLATGSAVSVGSSGTLAGTGTIGGDTSVSGTLAPGVATGTLAFTNSLALLSTAQLNWDLNPANTAIGGGVNDLATIGGSLTLDGVLNLSGGTFTGLAEGTTWRLFNYSGALTDNGLNIGTMPTLDAGQSWLIDTATTGQVNLTIIPEPASSAFLLLGGTLLLRRKRA